MQRSNTCTRRELITRLPDPTYIYIYIYIYTFQPHQIFSQGFDESDLQANSLQQLYETACNKKLSKLYDFFFIHLEYLLGSFIPLFLNYSRVY
jgi:hypothetical protein